MGLSNTCGDAAEEFRDLAQRLAALEVAAGGAPLLSVAEHAPCDEVPAWCGTPVWAHCITTVMALCAMMTWL